MRHTHRARVVFAGGYMAGALTVCLAAALVGVYAVARRGESRLADELADVGRLLAGIGPRGVVDIPPETLAELAGSGAVIENAGNPTGQPVHDTVLVKPDKELRYVLRPNVRIRVDTLKSKRPLNFDPPSLHTLEGGEMSAQVHEFIESQSLLTYTYSVDAQGRRTTLPTTEATAAVLMIGDSVAFGVGVGDDATAASCLQREVGDRFRIVNAGVGGYDGRQCAMAAIRWSRQRAYEGLIYVACQNDFGYETEEAAAVIARLASIADRVKGRIIVVFHAYLEYCAPDVFLGVGLAPGGIDKTHQLRIAVREECRRHGLAYVDWPEMVQQHTAQGKSLLARFALYADHCHLSPLGNRALARRLAAAMGEWR